VLLVARRQSLIGGDALRQLVEIRVGVGAHGVPVAGDGFSSIAVWWDLFAAAAMLAVVMAGAAVVMHFVN
jgi:hypothetical protein